MGAITLPARPLASVGAPLIASELRVLSRMHEVEQTGFDGYSVVRDIVERWVTLTGDASIPIDVLREQVRLTVYSRAGDRRSERKRQLLADQFLADAINECEVRIVPRQRDGQ